ncbi:BspA family leucine-rich repeat surface protein [Collinsella tanakaei]|uniref:BspA family leucine-rich repeat surface protein n=1 Tax=Collinsella tanakaei TaxID=626935 RepID=UPI0025A476E2|nr:BspA family leucine-rich repeat surface protein [Collinsella tanakaei]MDM8246647.1 BspA family leucine-rich repeat surface protein [Collinsella tanakaei]
MGKHIRLESVGYNAMVVGENGSASIDPLDATSIGGGGYATTYRVPAQPGLPVGGILKVFELDSGKCQEGERLRRKQGWGALYDEYNMLCALGGLDGHVPEAYACGFFVVDDGVGGLTYSPAFLMEEIGDPAERLDEVLREHLKPFEAGQVATFGLRMLDVLDLLADEGISHADLSPRNVYVRRSSDDEVFEWVYLIDFGQSKYTAKEVTPSFVPGVRPRMGTVEYCAPESIPRLAPREGDSDVCREHDELYGMRNDPAVDLWSLGALMYLLALRKAPRYSVSYAKRGKVSGFWRGDVKLEDDDALRVLIEEKRDSLSLPGYMDGERELLLSQAIALCTAWDPRDRDRLHIRRLLKRVAEGAGDERFQQMTYVSEITPALEDEDGSERGSHVEAGSVFAGVYKLTAPDGMPFSNAGADLLVFGGSEQAVDIRNYRYRGVSYAAEHVGPRYDMSNAGWGVKGRQFDSPWQSVRIVDFLTEVRPATTRAWFAGCARLTELLHIDRLNTSAVTDMQFMFAECSSLAELDVSGFDTSSATDMSGMFSECPSLAGLDVSGFDTSSATDLRFMFHGCSSLVSLDVSGFDTSAATSMSGMFDRCSSLAALDVSGFDTSSVTDMSWMFKDCSSLVSLDVSGFRTGSVTDFQSMFEGCSSLRALDVSGFDTSSATNMSWMFSKCSALTALDVSGFATGSVTDFLFMFDGCSSLENLDVSGFNTSAGTDMSGMFSDCSSLAALDVSGFRTGSVTDFQSMFDGCSSIAFLDVSGFDTSAATRLNHMFYGCGKLTSLDVSGFRTQHVESFESMFDGCSSLAVLDVSGFEASSATDLSSMFMCCGSLVNLNGWPFPIPEGANTTNMFEGCAARQ